MTNLRTNFYPPNSPQNFATPIHALIVAAGKGSRFGTEVPKQYLKTQDKTILQHSVARLNHLQITDLTIVIAPDDKVASNLSFEFTHPIYFACGGCEDTYSHHFDLGHSISPLVDACLQGRVV